MTRLTTTNPMLIPSSFRPMTSSTNHHHHAEPPLREEKEEEEAPPSPIPHAKDSDNAADVTAESKSLVSDTSSYAAAGRCLSKEAAALLDGQEAVARALREAEEAEVAVRAGGRKRSSRRTTIAPSRYGEFLSWDNVEAIGTPGTGKGLVLKNTDDDDDGGGGARNGDNAMTCPIPSFVPAAVDPTVKEVHDKVSALVQMAQDFLPPGRRGGGSQGWREEKRGR